LPNGTIINPITGEITIVNKGALLPGNYQLEITTTDITGGVTKHLITIILSEEQIAPVAVNDQVETKMNQSLVINILDNDYDIDGNIVIGSLAIISAPTKGSINYNSATGQITYTPNQNVIGNDNFTYTVKDNDGLTSNVATVNIVILIEADIDSDGDGIPDAVEIAQGSNPYDPCSPIQKPGYKGYVISNPIWAASDCDGDGVSNEQEVSDNTDPFDACELLFESIHLAQSTEWLNGDCDGDGVSNEQELKDNTVFNDPCDFVMGHVSLIPSDSWYEMDCDGDGVPNRVEQLLGTSIFDMCDFKPENITLTPSSEWAMADCDGDGVTNGHELKDKTGILNGCELLVSSITLVPSQEWAESDCDGDGVPNGQEMIDGPDTDGDGIPNFLDPDDDGDTLPTIEEWGSDLTTPRDTDGNGIPDYLDLDDNGDGVPTRDQLADLNQNGIPDYLENLLVIVNNDTISTGLDIEGRVNVLTNDINIFGDREIVIVNNPQHGSIQIDQTTGIVTYIPQTGYVGTDEFIYSICNTYNQCGQATVYITIDEIINPPQIFTPNNNGQNDLYVIRNIGLYPDNQFTVYNRWGNKVYEAFNYKNDWDGTANVGFVIGNKPLPVGTYFYVLTYGQNKSKTGFIYIKR
jgi:gliding motility-associated-like protein